MVGAKEAPPDDVATGSAVGYPVSVLRQANANRTILNRPIIMNKLIIRIVILFTFISIASYSPSGDMT